MPHPYTGNQATPTFRQVLTITEPNDGDPANVASIEPNALEKMADFVAYCMQNSLITSA